MEKTYYSSEYVEKIQFLNDTLAYICGDYGFVYQTKNAGNTWNEISPNIDDRITIQFRQDSTLNQKIDGLYLAYYQMFFNEHQTGYIWGIHKNPSIGRKSFKTISMMTGDDGKTWTTIKEKKLNKLVKEFLADEVPKNKKNINGIFFLNDSLAWDSHNDKELGIGISYSNDGGKTFKKANSLPDVGVKKWMLRDIIFVNQNEGFLFGGLLTEGNEIGIVMHSSNGGKDWKLLDKDWPHLHAATLFKDQIILVGKNGFIAKSPKLNLKDIK